VLVRVQCREQAGAAGAEDQDVGFDGLHQVKSSVQKPGHRGNRVHRGKPEHQNLFFGVLCG
ncbi:MAG: hypothetical protein ABL952_17885, partial [Pyrinomonadaceae bacterium]